MIQEYKELLLKDLCARLPYKVKCQIAFDEVDIHIETLESVRPTMLYQVTTSGSVVSIENVKPYLRPMSSMTDDERKELKKLCEEDLSEFAGFIRNGHGLSHDGLYMFDKLRQLEFCLSHHLDYRGLIDKGLALEAPKDMYK